ncbi:MAG: DUF1146 family protein [Bacilli bacterium]|nr:DUF1146 family protein [Bacilli bacterium]
MFFLPLIPLCFKALSAIDFSKVFKQNSTWQIRLLILLLSIIISYLLASAIENFIVRIYDLLVEV